jgi:polysaccharide export outer membrane protein
VKTNNSTKTEERYRIGYQDVLSISVFRHPELNTTVTINPDGTIYLPRATKPIEAYCKTERELKEIIEADYKSFLKQPFVTVTVAQQLSQSFGVIGAVEKPGNFYVNRRVPLLELLSFAGGPSKESGSKLIVARLGSSSACRLNMEQMVDSEQIVFRTFKIKDLQQGKASFKMQAGDVVSVLDSDIVYVYGNVNKPGEVKFREPRTLRQVIASAEGFGPNAKKDKIRIIRQKTDSSEWEETAIYNLRDIDSGKVQDPILQPNDIVVVSEDKVAKILGSIAKSMTGGLSNLPIFIF